MEQYTSYSQRINLNEIILYATNSPEMIAYVREGIGDYKQVYENLKVEGRYPACIEMRKDSPFNPYEAYYGLVSDTNDEKSNEKELHVIQNYSLHNDRIDDNHHKSLYEVTSKYFRLIGAERGYSSLPF